MFDGRERRRYFRIFLPDGQVRLMSDLLAVRVGKVMDISLGGLRFACETELAPGQEIDLDVTLPTGFRFRSTTIIRHAEKSPTRSNEYIYGVEFVNLGVQEIKELGLFIQSRLSKESGGTTGS